MKKLATLTLGLFLTAGVAFAQTPITSPVTTVTENTATDLTYGDDNITEITQTGLTNEAYIRQGTASNDLNRNTSIITQTGNSNFGKITTVSWAGWEPEDAENTITQTGNHNWARTVASTETFGNLAYTEITQTGDFNWGEQDQNRSERDGDLVIRQTSYGATGQFSGGAGQVLGSANDGNYAYQNMDHNGSGGYGEAIQNGNGNYAFQDFRRGTSLINQDGDQNWAKNVQNSATDYADFDQLGHRNIIDLNQSGNAYAEILQDGNDNKVFGLGGLGTVANSLNGSSLYVDQLGDGNRLFVDQTNGATATVMQDGVTNTSTIIQN